MDSSTHDRLDAAAGRAALIRRYALILGLAYVVLLLSAIGFFALQLDEREKAEWRNIADRVDQHALILDALAGEVANRIEELRQHAEAARIAIEYSVVASSEVEIDADERLRFRTADDSTVPDAAAISGTMDRQAFAEAKAEIRTAMMLVVDFRYLVSLLPIVDRASYVSQKGFAVALPGLAVGAGRLSSGAPASVLLRTTAPEWNSERYAVWLDGMRATDLVGTIVHAAPIDHAGRFQGAVAFEVSGSYLNRVNGDFDYRIGTTLLLGPTGALLAYPRAQERGVALGLHYRDALPADIADRVDRALGLTDRRVIGEGASVLYAERLDAAPWTLIYVGDRWAILGSLVAEHGPQTLALVAVLTLMLLIAGGLTRREFVEPASRLVEHIKAAGEIGPEGAAQVPVAWRPWFRTVTSMFRDNADLVRVRQEQEQLRRSEERLRGVLELSPAAAVIASRDGVIRFANRRTVEMFGYGPGEEMIGRSAIEMFATSRNRGRLIAEIRAGNPVESLDVRLRRVDGAEFDALLTLLPAESTEGPALVCWVYDISELRRIQRELEEAKAHAEAASLAKATFLATMSHEIRTPMNGVMTMAEILDQTRLSVDQREMTRTIRQSAAALLTVIDDVLDFSKIDAGKLVVEHVAFDPLEVVEGVLDLLAPPAESSGLALALALPEPIPMRLLGDPGRLRQILLNLGGNAVKFTERGAITIRMLPMGISADECRLAFEVEDTGIGLSSDQVEQLFQPFSQAESSTARRYGGTGRGLSISRRLVELMDGSIVVRSSPGVGSTFRVELPFGLVSDEMLRPAHDLTSATVLLAGYDPAEASAIGGLLALGGVGRVNLAGADGPSAQLPDLVIVNGRAGIVSVQATVSGLALPTGGAMPSGLITAPHATVSSLMSSVARAVGLDVQGVLPVPVHLRRLWDHVAVAAGRLPRDVLQAETTEVPVYDAPSIELARRHGAAVLVAEDNETNRTVIGRVLARMGVAHAVATNGEEALRQHEAAPYDLLLSDVHMPVLDGFELTRAIRAREAATGHSRLPIVALTADVLPETAERCIAAGMDGYLRKPVEIGRLEEVLRRHTPAVFEIRAIRADALPSAQAPGRGDNPRDRIGQVDPDIFDPEALVDAFGSFDHAAAAFAVRVAASAGPEIRAIETAFRKDDPAEVCRRAHAVSGALLSIGAVRLGRLVVDLRTAVDAGDRTTAEIYCAGLAESYGELARALEPLAVGEAPSRAAE